MPYRKSFLSQTTGRAAWLHLSIYAMLAFLCFHAQTYGQPYFFRHYQVENGLSNNTVYCSIQDKNGFLWFGTKDGLNRFDGYHFKIFHAHNDQHVTAPDFISCLLIDRNHKLWIGSRKGLYFFDEQKEIMVPFLDSLPEINSMQIDPKGQLWFTSGFTLCRYNFQTHTLKTFPVSKYFEATAVGISAEGLIWASTPDGFLNRYDELEDAFTRFNLFAHSAPASSNWIQKIVSAGSNRIFIGTSNQGLKEFDERSGEYKDLLTLNPDKTAIYVRDIIPYKTNEFWIATESGIFIYNDSSKRFINLRKNLLDPYSLSDNAVYTFCKDAEGAIWAGTYFGGVNYYSRRDAVFQKYFPDNSSTALGGSVIREIVEDHSGNLWIGTEDAGLNKMNPKTGLVTQFKPTGEKGSIAYSNIHGLLVVGNELWIGTFEHGLDIMDIALGKIKKHFAAGPGAASLKSNFIVSLLQAGDGTIYVGSGNSLFRYHPQPEGFDPVMETPAHIFVACMTEDHEKTIWVGTHDRGIYYFNPVTKKSGHFENEPGNPNSLSTNTINAIHEDGDHNLWFATEGGGLCRLLADRKTFTSYNTAQGFPENFVFKILEDHNRKLWLSTSGGLISFNPGNGSSTVYTKDNGLLNDQFNYNSGFKNADGRMYFGSVKGLISFKPDDFFKTQEAPPVFITGLQVQNKELDPVGDSAYLKQSIIYTHSISLPYDRSSLSIDFAALSYISPEMTTYGYFMEGLDKDWTLIKPNRRIYFNNLSPGTYVFKINASVNGFQAKNEKRIIIRIRPPFWQTWVAYFVYALALLALGYYLLRTYHIIVEDRKEKEIYEAKINFFTNIAHEIRTPLTLIKGPVENLMENVRELPQIREDVITMERNTNRLIALITQILDFRQTETKGFTINFERVNISAIVKETYLSFSSLAKKKNLEFTIDLPVTDIFTFADEDALYKILSNLFNNAIKYARKKVHARLFTADALHFTVELENDGDTIPAPLAEKIFEPFYRLKESIKQQGTGLGLALARSLTDLHGGRLYLKASGNGLNVFVLSLPTQAPSAGKKTFDKRPWHFAKKQ